MCETYEKIFNNYTERQLSLLCVHSKEICRSLEGSEYITPRVLGLSKSAIVYEYLDIHASVDVIWRNNPSLDPTVFFKIGSLLNIIHYARGNKLLHGDYVLHNIFFNKSGELCLIDFHPPEVIGYDESYLYGDGRTEMYLFLLNLTSSFGVKLALANVKYVLAAIRNFRRGYQPTGRMLSLISAMYRFYKIRRAGGFSRFNALTHLTCGFIFMLLSHA